MSACLSSPILDALDAHGPSTEELDADPVSLLDALASVTDPRRPRGVRHSFAAVLAVGACAVLTGARMFTAIAEWAHDLPAGVRFRLGFGRAVPSESTIRQVLQAIDADVLDAVVSGWLSAQAAQSAAPDPGRRAIAVDGKTARGARGPDGRQVHYSGPWTTPAALCSGRAWSTGSPMRSTLSRRCWTGSSSPMCS